MQLPSSLVQSVLHCSVVSLQLCTMLRGERERERGRERGREKGRERGREGERKKGRERETERGREEERGDHDRKKYFVES